MAAQQKKKRLQNYVCITQCIYLLNEGEAAQSEVLNFSDAAEGSVALVVFVSTISKYDEKHHSKVVTCHHCTISSILKLYNIV